MGKFRKLIINKKKQRINEKTLTEKKKRRNY